jgi:hypothetical protein
MRRFLDVTLSLIAEDVILGDDNNRIGKAG